MPRKNTVKDYIENGYYHVYNRGVDKRLIYKDTQDYKVFLKYLKEYLSPPPKSKYLKKNFTLKGSTFKGVARQPHNYNKKMRLVVYCLMPNHFHLLLQQKGKYTIKEFMRSLATRYSMYFNKKYRRVGSLFEGIYKAVRIKDDEYLLHLSRYIHLNPSEYTDDLEGAYSSYADYLGLRNTKWVKPKIVLDFFNTYPQLDFGVKNLNTYKQFVESYKINSLAKLGKLTLEDQEED